MQGRANDIFSPATISRIGATNPVECLSEYGQMNDGSFYIPLNSDEGVTVTSGINSFQACVDLCSAQANCQLVTYDYQAKTCSVRVWIPPVYEG